MLDPVRLIAEVRKRPGLYDLERPLDRHEKIQLWKEVGTALFREWPNYDRAAQYDKVLMLQKKWRSLRDAYNRELRSRRMPVRTNRRVYIYFKKMSFLGGFEGDVSTETEDDEEAPPENHLEMDGEDTINMPNNETDEVPIPSSKKKRRVKRPKREPYAPTEEVELPLFPMETSENDSDKLFLLSFLPEMRQLSLDIKMWVRSQIANVMQEAVSHHMSNSTPNSGRENGRGLSIKRQRTESYD